MGTLTTARKRILLCFATVPTVIEICRWGRPVTLEESEPPAANVPQEPTRLLDFAEAFYKATDALGTRARA